MPGSVTCSSWACATTWPPADQAVEAARRNPDLTELASTEEFSQPDGVGRASWMVFEVADADRVVPLENLPVVLTPRTTTSTAGCTPRSVPRRHEEQPNPPKTSGPAMDWYLDPTRWDMPLATSGPPRLAADRP